MDYGESLVVAKLRERGLTPHAPWHEIERVLNRTVNPKKCLEIIKKIREDQS